MVDETGASCHGLLPDQFTLALDAPAVARQIAIAADDAVARNGQCDRVGGAGASDRTGRGEGADPTGQLHVGHRPADRDRAKLLPDAALERRPAHIEREMKSLRQACPRSGSPSPGHRGRRPRSRRAWLGETGGEIRLQLVVVGADQNGADALGATGDQHLAQGAFADRIGEDVDGNIGMRCRGCKPRGVSEIMRFIGSAP